MNHSKSPPKSHPQGETRDRQCVENALIQAHNPKVAGSNPAPATQRKAFDQGSQRLFSFCVKFFVTYHLFLTLIDKYKRKEAAG